MASIMMQFSWDRALGTIPNVNSIQCFMEILSRTLWEHFPWSTYFLLQGIIPMSYENVIMI